MSAAPPSPPPSLIEFPCLFPIKVMGIQCDELRPAVESLVRRFDPEFNPQLTTQRPSSGGKYLGITVSVNAVSRAQLDEIYRALTGHPLVKVVL